MRVIVCGGRDYSDADAVEQVLLALNPHHVTIVHGAAPGADTLAGDLGHQLGFDIEPYPADWDKHGRAAGPIRNKQMLDSGADLVIAFPGGRGTTNMVLQAEKAGVPVWQET